MNNYYRVMTWLPADDRDVRKVFREVMGRIMAQKYPRQPRLRAGVLCERNAGLVVWGDMTLSGAERIIYNL